MRPTKNDWPQTEAGRGTQFIAQLLREMLSLYAFESFRPLSLDVITRLLEVIEAISSVKSEHVPPAALDPIFEEISWSLKKDSVANEIAGDFVDELLYRVKQSKKDLGAIYSAASTLLSRIDSRYQEKVEQKIIALYDANRKDDLRNFMASYCSYLLNQGYSKSFIFEYVERSFFDKDVTVDDGSQIRNMFSDFNGDDQAFEVIVAVSGEFASYIIKATRDRDCIASEMTEEVHRYFAEHDDTKDYIRFFSYNTEAKDRHSAALKAEEYLNAIHAITFLSKRGVVFSWSRRKYVFGPDQSESGFPVVDAGIPLQRHVAPRGRVIKSLSAYYKQITSNFDDLSAERLLSSVRISALARASSNSESRLISLWSAIEVLLSDPPPSTARIFHYVNLIVPCICLKYVRRYIIALHDELTIGYRTKFRQLVASLPEELGVDAYTRFTFLVYDDRFQDERKNLLTMCSDNPLALHRLWKLEKDFSKPASMLKSIESHENRVKWQIHRIYRARNNFVHAGKIAPYIDGLVLNCFEYYRSSVGALLYQSEKIASSSNVDALELLSFKLGRLRRSRPPRCSCGTRRV